ncbi:MAG: hypothetical protein EP341_09905 [Sphingomonadales bacterium]|nr:MAG: hypothetical protein EP341_09905 [Sphingomonadales bacterium]
MMNLIDIALIKRPGPTHTPATQEERTARRALRAARRTMFLQFVEDVFAHVPKHPTTMVRDSNDGMS